MAVFKHRPISSHFGNVQFRFDFVYFKLLSKKKMIHLEKIFVSLFLRTYALLVTVMSHNLWLIRSEFCYIVDSSLCIVLLGIVLSSLKLNIYVYIQADDCALVGILIRSSRSDIWTKSLNSGWVETCTRLKSSNQNCEYHYRKNRTFEISISQLLRYLIWCVQIASCTLNQC